jgi:hypothetical protein
MSNDERIHKTGFAEKGSDSRRETERMSAALKKLRSELQRKPMNGQHLDVRVVERTKNRNRARDTFLDKPGRKEEQNLIKMLERDLAVVTQRLAALGKELIEYGRQLVAQEDEYNYRFGADPSIAVLGPKSLEKSLTTTFAIGFPRLSSGYYKLLCYVDEDLSVSSIQLNQRVDPHFPHIWSKRVTECLANCETSSIFS